MRIKSITFKNFKVLKDAVLPLEPLTIVVGANGSGKSTIWQALKLPYSGGSRGAFMSVGGNDSPVGISIETDSGSVLYETDSRGPEYDEESMDFLRKGRRFNFEAAVIGSDGQLRPATELTDSGSNLAVVLDQLRDESPERFEELIAELGNWLPDYDRILFETPAAGKRSIKLRTRLGHHTIRMEQLSDGTRIVLALLTLAYLPKPPTLMFIEEPDRGIHPRLLRHVKDALYRLAFPAPDSGRTPIQIIITTHSPFLLNEFSEFPELIVVAERKGLYSTFHKLESDPGLHDVLLQQPLGEIWFSGILGGVPAN